MSAIVNTFLSLAGEPILGASPTIRIWEVADASHSLVIIDDSMSEVTDGSPAVGDGFYKYVFTTYDEAKEYVVRVDAGASIPVHSRYYVAEIATCDVVLDSNDIQDIVDGVWDEPVTDHLNSGSTGEAVNLIKSDVSQLRIDVTTALAIVEELLKYECNRTRIDKNAHTLTVYDDDGVTPLKVFDLYDSTGGSSIDEICERVPQ